MTLKLYNSATSQKEDFKSLSQNKVSMYCCGPTVYDAPHLGNFRTFVFYDLVKRVLVQNGFEVNQVINITDIDDKIIKASKILFKSTLNQIYVYIGRRFKKL